MIPVLDLKLRNGIGSGNECHGVSDALIPVLDLKHIRTDNLTSILGFMQHDSSFGFETHLLLSNVAIVSHGTCEHERGTLCRMLRQSVQQK
jgi:hypothetical protein